MSQNDQIEETQSIAESFQIDQQEDYKYKQNQTEQLREAIEDFKQYISNKDILSKIAKEQAEHDKLFQDLINQMPQINLLKKIMLINQIKKFRKGVKIAQNNFSYFNNGQYCVSHIENFIPRKHITLKQEVQIQPELFNQKLKNVSKDKEEWLDLFRNSALTNNQQQIDELIKSIQIDDLEMRYEILTSLKGAQYLVQNESLNQFIENLPELEKYEKDLFNSNSELNDDAIKMFQLNFKRLLLNKEEKNYKLIEKKILSLFGFLKTYPEILQNQQISNEVLKPFILYHFELDLIVNLFKEEIKTDLWKDFINKNLQLKISQMNERNSEHTLKFFEQNYLYLDSLTHNAFIYQLRSKLEIINSKSLIQYLFNLQYSDLNLWNQIEKINKDFDDQKVVPLFLVSQTINPFSYDYKQQLEQKVSSIPIDSISVDNLLSLQLIKISKHQEDQKIVEILSEKKLNSQSALKFLSSLVALKDKNDLEEQYYINTINIIKTDLTENEKLFYNDLMIQLKRDYIQVKQF